MSGYREILEKAERSLEASKTLLEKGFYAFALSRAYYTMFYCAEAILLTKGIRVSKHSAVIALLGREFVKTGEVPHRFFTHLRTAFNLRQTADYSFVVDITEEEARENIRRAEEFLEFTRRYLISKGFLEG
ncbi:MULTISPECIES: HEPN domain-containing protein [unclassified Thermococcus]|uniref:HEPN domain-containing protein n=1 Tax=unclassified Thermococcus TaxID=2627626 RepID=UPI00143C3156|nr:MULTISPECIES: HEPN domain-containing protein [unclassified Thermococcus]NJE54990.1 HEPN domain-containing protein [Thermococcus sp. 21S9]